MSIGDYEIGDEIDRPKRGYTTRAKEEARRTEVKFVGDVRRWETRHVLWNGQRHHHRGRSRRGGADSGGKALSQGSDEAGGACTW